MAVSQIAVEIFPSLDQSGELTNQPTNRQFSQAKHGYKTDFLLSSQILSKTGIREGFGMDMNISKLASHQ